MQLAQRDATELIHGVLAGLSGSHTGWPKAHRRWCSRQVAAKADLLVDTQLVLLSPGSHRMHGRTGRAVSRRHRSRIPQNSRDGTRAPPRRVREAPRLRGLTHTSATAKEGEGEPRSQSRVECRLPFVQHPSVEASAYTRCAAETAFRNEGQMQSLGMQAVARPAMANAGRSRPTLAESAWDLAERGPKYSVEITPSVSKLQTNSAQVGQFEAKSTEAWPMSTELCVGFRPLFWPTSAVFRPNSARDR